MNNIFEILEISENYEINRDELEKNYTNILAKSHPDNFTKPQDKFDATNKMLKINDAYEILSDNIKRAEWILQKNGVFVNGKEKNIEADAEYLEKLLDMSSEIENDKQMVEDFALLELKKNEEALLKTFRNKDFQTAGRILLDIIYLKGIQKHCGL